MHQLYNTVGASLSVSDVGTRGVRYDILLVDPVDRFARSPKVLVGLLEELHAVGVAFRSATEPIDTSTATGRMLVQLLGVFGEFERATVIDLVVAGMAPQQPRPHRSRDATMRS